jgi:hypothetical protein
MTRRVSASTTVRAAPARVREVLLDDPGWVFGEAYELKPTRLRRLTGELSVPIGSGLGVHQEVALRLGIPRTTSQGLVLPVAWEAIRREDVLPAFDGELLVSEDRAGTRLTLGGAYSVPLGPVGWLADRIFGRQLAGRSLHAFVDRLASRLDFEIERRIESTMLHVQ